VALQQALRLPEVLAVLLHRPRLQAPPPSKPRTPHLVSTTHPRNRCSVSPLVCSLLSSCCRKSLYILVEEQACEGAMAGAIFICDTFLLSGEAQLI